MTEKMSAEALKEMALTHRSFGSPHNARLAWLGRPLLEWAVSRALSADYPSASERELSALRTALLRTRALAGAARRAGLSERLRVGEGAWARGNLKRRRVMLAAALAALVAAEELGGGDAAALTRKLLAEDMTLQGALLAAGGVAALRCAKQLLWRRARQRGLARPSYHARRISRDGRVVYQGECRVDGRRFAAESFGPGVATQLAAARALVWLEQDDAATGE